MKPVSRLALVAVVALVAACQLAPAAASARSIRFGGRAVQAPPSWPVYRLARHPGMCVRLDRRAVYLGRPAANERCPAHVVGRRRAILVEPVHRHAGSSALPAAPSSVPAGGGIFTGLGFDACSAPSATTMTAWLASPYRAVGVYIGGVNRACAQPNLTASWVGAEVAEGWHLIPVYVGLQSPTSDCSKCAKLNSAQAAAQGSAAAIDAVAKAGAVAIGPRSPIYYDMESYKRTTSSSAATLAFLQAWTAKLHSLGYASGVYTSSSSGVVDLVGALGGGYAEPDDIWFANWNGEPNLFDSNIPATAWTPHRRIHQYRGGHNESYGGALINIDSNYVDAAIATAGETEPLGFFDLATSPSPGQVRVAGWAFDPNAPTLPLAIRVYVGGRADTPGALKYELGTVASGTRPDVGSLYPEAGPRHGFDVSFATVKAGAQPVCAYALGIPPGGDRLLGCRTVQVPVAITLSGAKATKTGAKTQIACKWPPGLTCQGSLTLRATIKVTKKPQGQPPQTHWARLPLGTGSFRLAGGQTRVFAVSLSRQGRLLLKQRRKLQAELVATNIGGGSRVAKLVLRSGATRRQAR